MYMYELFIYMFILVRIFTMTTQLNPVGLIFYFPKLCDRESFPRRIYTCH